MNHHFLPVNQVEEKSAKAILGWNYAVNEFFAHVYEVREDGLLGALLLSTAADSVYPSEVEGLEAWLERKAVSVPKSVINAVADDQARRSSSHSAKYDIFGNSLDEPIVREQLLLLC